MKEKTETKCKFTKAGREGDDASRYTGSAAEAIMDLFKSEKNISAGKRFKKAYINFVINEFRSMDEFSKSVNISDYFESPYEDVRTA